MQWFWVIEIRKSKTIIAKSWWENKPNISCKLSHKLKEFWIPQFAYIPTIEYSYKNISIFYEGMNIAYLPIKMTEQKTLDGDIISKEGSKLLSFLIVQIGMTTLLLEVYFFIP